MHPREQPLAHVFIRLSAGEILGIFLNMEKKSKAPKEVGKAQISEKERHKGRLDKAENRARVAAGKDRKQKAGHEAVSDQKSHEYH